jgi:hypothetical protein
MVALSLFRTAINDKLALLSGKLFEKVFMRDQQGETEAFLWWQ